MLYMIVGMTIRKDFFPEKVKQRPIEFHIYGKRLTEEEELGEDASKYDIAIIKMEKPVIFNPLV